MKALSRIASCALVVVTTSELEALLLIGGVEKTVCDCEGRVEGI